MQVDFLLKALELKDETRRGWEVRGIEAPESVAAHSWGVAFLAFLLAGEADVDRQKAVEMAILHDVHEAVSGDIRSAGLSEEAYREKKEQEEDGFRELMALAGTGTANLEELWAEYEHRETRTARFVKDIDLLETAVQALYYYVNERYTDEDEFFREWDGVEEFFAGTRDDLHTDAAKQLFDRLMERYNGAQP